MSIKTGRRQAGVTMIELIMFMVIVAIALAGIVAVMRMTTAASADPLRRKQALMLAEGLLAEVRQAQFSFCDPTSGDEDTAASSAACAVPENWGLEPAGIPRPPRPFDNINDYVSKADTAEAAFNDPAGRLTDAAGNPIDVSGYSVTLTITPDRLNGIGPAAPTTSADVDVLRIRVTVRYPEEPDRPVVLDGYRTRYLPGLR
jgi:MSHA pilin protein MshD